MDAEFLSCGKPEAEKQSHPQILRHQQTSDQAGFDPMGAKDSPYGKPCVICTLKVRATTLFPYICMARLSLHRKCRTTQQLQHNWNLSDDQIALSRVIYHVSS
jgi:hypothetical protein